jgi:hypothetical protein
MSPAGLNVLKRTGVVRKFKCPLKKMQPSCPGSRDLNWTGKGLIDDGADEDDTLIEVYNV